MESSLFIHNIGISFLTIYDKIITINEGDPMPTYVYRSVDSEKSCDHCRSGFEVIQRITEPALTLCPNCKNAIYRVLFAPAVVIKGSPIKETDKKIKEYEKEGKWSHAAELADKEAEKTKREDLKTRALENYKKAGYNFDKYDK
jgi:putative FmdB family regulatory protein